MRISGLVVEYNPFHNGHLYHLSKSKEWSDYCIAIMGGHFLQRGEPALYNKWIRTKMALAAGVDIVIEIPTIYSCQSAELFAYGGISILNQLNIIDFLVFGSETNHLTDFYTISKILASEPKLYKDLLKSQLRDGQSFPRARSNALEEYFRKENINIPSLHHHNILKNPNDILGIEYIKWLLRLQSNMTPKPIQRIGSEYHEQEINHYYASASAIRNKILSQNDFIKHLKGYLPPSSISIIEEYKGQFQPGQLESLSKSILSILMRMNPNELNQYLDIKEGLQDRFYHRMKTNSIEKYISSIKTKRYTHTRIQRILCHILLDLKAEVLHECNERGGGQYIRILGFTKKGKEILPLIKKQSNLPMITNLSKSYKKLNSIQKKMIHYDILATNLYYTHFANTSAFNNNMDFLNSPIIL